MKYVCLTKLARRHPETWKSVWRIIKQQAKATADLLKDETFTGLASHFNSEIDIPLDNIPAAAQQLLPADVILNN